MIVYAGQDPLTGKPLRLRESTTDKDEAEARRILYRLSAQIDEQRHAKTDASLRVAMGAWLRRHEIEETTREGPVTGANGACHVGPPWPLRRGSPSERGGR